jgi:hypothetical protein
MFQFSRVSQVTALSMLMLLLVAGAAPAQTPGRSPQQPARDTSTQAKAAQALPAGLISGRVVTADTGRPVKRARVLVTAAELPQGRATLTDDSGAFEITALPAGRYSLNASKTGFIALSYGQRRPLQAGTPLQLAEGQQLKGVELRLPRGGAISGHIFDEDGEPMPGAAVRLMRYEYLQGDRRLVPVGADQTDDRGLYRIWGLNPGEYYVSAIGRSPNPGRGPGAGRMGGGPAGGAVMAEALAGAAGNVVMFPGQADSQDAPVGYAPTYYPGATSIAEARPVALGLSAEALNIDFGVQLVRTARVGGRVVNPDGTASSTGNVTLAPDGAQVAAGPMGTSYAARIQWDGAFTIANVPPGRYTLRARGDDGDAPAFGILPLTVAGDDVGGVNVVLAAGATLSGTVTFEPGRQAVPADLSQIRVTAPAADGSAFGRTPEARVDQEGKFTLEGVPPGSHLVRSNGAPRGWMLKAAVVDGRDVVDVSLEIRSGQKITGVSLVFSDKLSEVGGLVTDDQGVPVTDFTVLAFPTDPATWRPQSRRIMTSRPDQTGRFQIRGLPPGEYYLATVDPAEQGEWFEPAFLDEQRTGAVRMTLSEGDVKTQDFKIAGR